MSTITDVGPSTGAAAPARSRRAAKALAVVVLAALALMALTAGALSVWDMGYEGRILPGVRVGDTDLSGLDRTQALAALGAADRFGDGRLLLQTPDGDVAIPYADMGRHLDADALVGQALAAGREQALPARAITQVRQAVEGRSIDATVTIDEAALARRVVGTLAPLRRTPVNATITMSDGGAIRVTSAIAGRDVDPAPVLAAALAALRRTDAPEQLVLPVATSEVRPEVEDDVVLAAQLAATTMARDLEVAFEDRSWTIRAARIRSWLRFETIPGGAILPVVDEARVPAVFGKSIAKTVKRSARSAQYLVARSGRTVGVVAGSNGRRFDPAATTRAVMAALEARATGGSPAPVEIRTSVVEPKLTTEEAARKAPVMRLLGSWKTWFPISERNFNGANIWVPARLINGTVLRPGQTFDWWDAIWPVTPARGFGPGGIIRVNRTEPTGALGGGMCSSSTTLFNAAMRAGLDIGQRSNHRYYIDRYPLGLDATVSIIGGSRQSMTFRNDTRNPIFIRGIRTRSGGVGWVKYEIWGVPDGRTTTISKPAISNVRQAVTREVLVDTLPRGDREQIEYPSDGMNVAVSRTVRAASGRVLHRDTWVSRYVLWNGIVEVGR